MIKRIVITGDSIIEDIGLSSFVAAARMAEMNLTFNQLDDENSIELINTGMGGHTVDMIAARFERDTLRWSPDLVIINGGTNDLWGWGTSDIDFENAWNLIIEKCVENKIVAGVLGIVPASGFPNELMHKRDKWNSIMESLTKGNENVVYIDAGQYVGAYRTVGPEGNLWDQKEEYDLDGVHFTRSGCDKIVQAILEGMREFIR